MSNNMEMIKALTEEQKLELIILTANIEGEDYHNFVKAFVAYKKVITYERTKRWENK